MRQESAVEVRGFLAQVPDLREERDIPLHGVTARLGVGGADSPAGSRRFHGDRTLSYVPLSRLRWDAAGIAYTVSAWGLAEDRLLRVGASLRPLGDDHAAGEPEDRP